MRSLVLARREIGAAFETPAGWVVMAFFPAVAAAFFFVLGPFYALGEASLRGFFGNMPWLLAIVAPALTMRAWAEERRGGTEELLLTWPYRVRELVWGKFLGAWALLAIALTATLGAPLTVAALGDLDPGPVLGGYLGTLLSGAAGLAVGFLFSACTRSQAVAWLISVAVLLTLNLIGAAATAAAMPPALGRLLLAVDLQTHFHSIARGVADLRAMAYYAGVTVLALCACGLVIAGRSGARAAAPRSGWVTGALLLALVAGLLALAGRVRLRADLTEHGIYSLDPATRGLLARLDDRLQVKLYFNRDLEGAEHLLPQRLRIEDFLEEIETAGAPWASVETVDPTTDLVAQRDAEHVGIQPLQIATGDVGEVSVVLAYQGLELRYQDRNEVIPFTVPAELEFAFATRLSSLQRPRRPEIAFFSREPMLGPPIPGIPRRVPEERIYHELRAAWTSRYTVRDVELTDPAWKGEDTVALVVARPEALREGEVAALDAYLAGGGRVLILADTETVHPRTFARTPLVSGLEGWLAGCGLRVAPNLVWDDSCMMVDAGYDEVETQSSRQRLPVRMRYGLFPVIEGDGLARDHVVTASLGSVSGFWMHPVEVRVPPSGVHVATLLRSSAQSWILPPDTPVVLDREVILRVGAFARQGGASHPAPLAVALHGLFPPQLEHAGLTPAPGLLVVIGDSDLFHNVVLNNSQAGGANVAFAANLVDWLAGDESLIGLRTRGETDRSLMNFRAAYIASQGGRATTDAENRVLDREAKAYARARERWIAWGNVLGPALAAGLLAWLARWHRRARGAQAFAGAAQEAGP